MPHKIKKKKKNVCYFMHSINSIAITLDSEHCLGQQVKMGKVKTFWRDRPGGEIMLCVMVNFMCQLREAMSLKQTPI